MLSVRGAGGEPQHDERDQDAAGDVAMGHPPPVPTGESDAQPLARAPSGCRIRRFAQPRYPAAALATSNSGGARSGRAVEELQFDGQPVRNDQETTVAWSAHRALAPGHVGVRDPDLLTVHPTEECQAVA